ncbi:hypothetical protein LMTR13_03295 [Bradyrhizobium icense]|uniref:Uncharacterized protein n=1 Tax=Bradyrhizobium icense TaxID=1274631 RepID=A0A1B1U9B2_9BRAD|nr:hypothetical protein LMTR13_03295 [Bradyrhizobium icense]
MPPCSRPSRTLRAALAVAATGGSSLTAAVRDSKHRVQVGTEGWFQSNKRISHERKQVLDSKRWADFLPAGERSMRASMLFVPFVQRSSDNFVHWFRSIHVRNVTDAAADLM